MGLCPGIKVIDALRGYLEGIIIANTFIFKALGFEIVAYFYMCSYYNNVYLTFYKYLYTVILKSLFICNLSSLLKRNEILKIHLNLTKKCENILEKNSVCFIKKD